MNRFQRSLGIILIGGAEVARFPRHCKKAPVSKAFSLLSSMLAFFYHKLQCKADSLCLVCEIFTLVGMDTALLPGKFPPKVTKSCIRVHFAMTLKI